MLPKGFACLACSFWGLPSALVTLIWIGSLCKVFPLIVILAAPIEAGPTFFGLQV